MNCISHEKSLVFFYKKAKPKGGTWHNTPLKRYWFLNLLLQIQETNKIQAP